MTRRTYVEEILPGHTRHVLVDINAAPWNTSLPMDMFMVLDPQAIAYVEVYRTDEECITKWLAVRSDYQNTGVVSYWRDELAAIVGDRQLDPGEYPVQSNNLVDFLMNKDSEN